MARKGANGLPYAGDKKKDVFESPEKDSVSEDSNPTEETRELEKEEFFEGFLEDSENEDGGEDSNTEEPEENTPKKKKKNRKHRKS